MKCDDLDLLWQGELMGKTVKMSFKGKILQEMSSRTEY